VSCILTSNAERLRMRLVYAVYHSDSDSPYKGMHYEHDGDKIDCCLLHV